MANQGANVQHGDMVELINTFHTTVEKFHQHFARADVAKDGVDMAWDSAASDTLVQAMFSWQQQCANLTGQLENFQDSLEKVANYYVGTDTDTAATMNSMASEIGTGIEATA